MSKQKVREAPIVFLNNDEVISLTTWSNTSSTRDNLIGEAG